VAKSDSKESEIRKLIKTICDEGCYSKLGRNAISELVGGGEEALDAFLKMQHKLPKTDLHPRDLADTISDVFCEFARKYSDALIDRFATGDIEEFQTFWALGYAEGQRSIDILLAGLKSKAQYSRWAAAESLIRRKSKQAIPALIERLNDRSSIVKTTILQAMKSNKRYRLPEALPALRRISSSKSNQKHSPGSVKTAEELVKLICGEDSF